MYRKFKNNQKYKKYDKENNFIPIAILFEIELYI